MDSDKWKAWNLMPETSQLTVHAVYPVVPTTVTGITVDSKTFWKISHVLLNFELPYIGLDSLWMFAKFHAQFWNTEHHRQAFNSKENNRKVSACVKQSCGLLSS